VTTSSLWSPFQQLVYPHPPGLNMMIFHSDVPFRTPPLGRGGETILKIVRLAEEVARPDDTTEAFCSIPRCGSSRTPAVTCVLAPGRGPPGSTFPFAPKRRNFVRGPRARRSGSEPGSAWRRAPVLGTAVLSFVCLLMVLFVSP
jgi:hypothetical protein